MNYLNKPIATAILAVYNGETTIATCLTSLLTQSVPIEIIIIDDGSTDHTVQFLKTIIKDFPDRKISFLKQNHLGPALARNLGARHATTPILLFVDADMRFDDNYVKDLIAPISPNVIGTYTTNEVVDNWDNVWARSLNYEVGWEDQKRFPKNPPRLGTDFRAILKSEFDRVGGFDNIGYTDTWSLFYKLGEKPLSTNALCYHANPSSLSAVFRQACWSSKRPYKFGLFGTFIALLRTSLPFSLIGGIYQSLRHSEPRFLIFKIVYDLGRLVGIIEMIFKNKLTK